MEHLALNGIKVVELEGLAPSCLVGMILADHGAKVTMVSPPISKATIPKDIHEMNRGKRQLFLDLKSVYGKSIWKKLIQWADVVIDPYRATTLPKLGFGFEELTKINPQIIYCSLTSYGSTGGLKNHAGHDLNFASTSGLLRSIYDGESGKIIIPGIYTGDAAGASVATISIMMALLKKKNGFNKSQKIDFSYSESILYLNTLSRSLNRSGMMDSVDGNRGMIGGTWPNSHIYYSKDKKPFALQAIELHLYKEFLKSINFEPDYVLNTMNEEEQINLISKKVGRMSSKDLITIVMFYYSII